MINFGGMLVPQPLYRSHNSSCPGYSADLTTFSPTVSTENSRRFSVTNLLELGELQAGKAEDADASESEYSICSCEILEISELWSYNSNTT